MRAGPLRRTALSFPEAEEVETWGQATFRVRRKMFCILGEDGKQASIKATPEAQAELLAANPAVYSFAPYVGRHGWVTVDVAAADPAEVAELLEDAWRRTAPKRVVAAYDRD
ncbi:MAG: hypothetical protein JWP14_2593 [Frankiales bacterium]|nr:hypothetical protein [Frankiales bacterium]